MTFGSQDFWDWGNLVGIFTLEKNLNVLSISSGASSHETPPCIMEKRPFTKIIW